MPLHRYRGGVGEETHSPLGWARGWGASAEHRCSGKNPLRQGKIGDGRLVGTAGRQEGYVQRARVR